MVRRLEDWTLDHSGTSLLVHWEKQLGAELVPKIRDSSLLVWVILHLDLLVPLQIVLSCHAKNNDVTTQQNNNIYIYMTPSCDSI